MAWQKHLRNASAWSLRTLALCLLAVAITSARASDPQSYTVAIDETGDKSLDTALGDASQLQSLRDKAPAGP